MAKRYTASNGRIIGGIPDDLDLDDPRVIRGLELQAQSAAKIAEVNALRKQLEEPPTRASQPDADARGSARPDADARGSGYFPAAARGLIHSQATPLAGAALGAAVGSVVPVVGTAAGATIGYLGGQLVDLASGAWNLGNYAAGTDYYMPTFGGAINKAVFGEGPRTLSENAVEAAAAGVGSAKGLMYSLGKLPYLASQFRPAVLERAGRIAAQATQNPGRQIVSGGTAGLAQSVAAAAGAPVPVQLLAGYGGGFVPLVGLRRPPNVGTEVGTEGLRVLKPHEAHATDILKEGVRVPPMRTTEFDENFPPPLAAAASRDAPPIIMAAANASPEALKYAESVLTPFSESQPQRISSMVKATTGHEPMNARRQQATAHEEGLKQAAVQYKDAFDVDDRTGGLVALYEANIITAQRTVDAALAEFWQADRALAQAAYPLPPNLTLNALDRFSTGGGGTISLVQDMLEQEQLPPQYRATLQQAHRKAVEKQQALQDARKNLNIATEAYETAQAKFPTQIQSGKRLPITTSASADTIKMIQQVLALDEMPAILKTGVDVLERQWIATHKGKEPFFRESYGLMADATGQVNAINPKVVFAPTLKMLHALKVGMAEKVQHNALGQVIYDSSGVTHSWQELSKSFGEELRKLSPGYEAAAHTAAKYKFSADGFDIGLNKVFDDTVPLVDFKAAWEKVKNVTTPKAQELLEQFTDGAKRGVATHFGDEFGASTGGIYEPRSVSLLTEQKLKHVLGERAADKLLQGLDSEQRTVRLIANLPTGQRALGRFAEIPQPGLTVNDVTNLAKFGVDVSRVSGPQVLTAALRKAEEAAKQRDNVSRTKAFEHANRLLLTDVNEFNRTLSSRQIYPSNRWLPLSLRLIHDRSQDKERKRQEAMRKKRALDAITESNRHRY